MAGSSKRSRHPVIKGIFWYATLASLALLVLAYAALFINPGKFWIPAFFGLAYPYLVVLNLVWAIFWAVLRKWRFVIPLIGILAGWGILTAYLHILPGSQQDPGPDDVKVLSYNVKNFSYDDKSLQDNPVSKKIFDLARDEAPDILCMQEFYSRGSRPVNLLDSLATVIGNFNSRYINYRKITPTKIVALATFSKYPIIHDYYLESPDERRFAMITDLLIGSDTVRVFNVHLASFLLKDEDLILLTDFDLPESEEKEIKSGYMKIFSKMKRAYEKRSKEVVILREEIRKSPYPLILCGDFNDPPSSFSYYQVSRGLNDTFKKRGNMLGSTYAGRLPSMRIDYILFSDDFECSGFRINRKVYSDHFPVSAILKLAGGR